MLHPVWQSIPWGFVKRHIDDIHHTLIGSHCDDDNREYQTHTKYRDKDTHRQENHFQNLSHVLSTEALTTALSNDSEISHHCQNQSDK